MTNLELQEFLKRFPDTMKVFIWTPEESDCENVTPLTIKRIQQEVVGIVIY